MTKFFNRFAKDESGATAIEYGLIAALIAVVIIAATQALGTNVSGKFQEVADAMNYSSPEDLDAGGLGGNAGALRVSGVQPRARRRA